MIKKIKYENGDTYHGEVTKDGVFGEYKRHGKGVYKENTSGDIYEGDFIDNKRTGKGILKFHLNYNAVIYEGDFVDGNRHGIGVLKWKSYGTVYDGNFVDGRQTGKGVYKWTNGDIYEGDFVDGNRQGKGIFRWTNGNVYTGDFKNGEKTGKGVFKYASGDVYEGDFVDGNRQGKGIFKWRNGDIYTGDFKNGEKTGKGVFKYASGDVYEGDFINGNFHGKGVYKWIAGDIYEGDFVNEKFHGKGALKLANGNVYKGDFLDGKRTGKGVFRWTNGDVYEGDFVEDKRTGKGVFKWANGNKYEGEFKDDKLHGKGTLISKEAHTLTVEESFEDPKTGKLVFNLGGGILEGDLRDGNFLGKVVFTFNGGDVYTGDWVNLGMNGKGICKFSDGDIYEGDYSEWLRKGKGIYKWTDGRVYKGDFLNSVFHGKGLIIWPNGDEYEGDFKSGKQTGSGVLKLESGDVYEGEFINGNFHGKGVYKWIDGDIYDGDFVNGSFHGKGIRKYFDGIIYEGDFIDDQRSGKGILRWPNGDVFEGDYINDKRTGKGIFKWRNGNWYIGFWQFKERSGFGTLYEKGSEKQITGFWINDQLLETEISKKVQKGEYVVALEMCRNVYSENEVLTEIDEDFIKEIENSGYQKFETHYFILKNKIMSFENIIMNLKWNELIESNRFKEIPPTAFQEVKVPTNTDRGFPHLINIGSIKMGLFKTVKVPLLIPFSSSSGLSFIVETKENKDMGVKALQLTAFRVLFSIPDGKCKFSIIDSEQSGQNFSNLFGLDNRILEKEIWDDDHEIRDGLSLIKNSIPKITSELLKTKYKDLIEYNKLEKHSKQPFQFLLIANFPRGFNKESAGLLLSILKNGQKAGIYCLMSIDYSCPLPFSDFKFEEFRNIAVEYDFKERKVLNSPGFEILNKFEIEIESKLPDDIEYQKEIINGNLNKPINVELDAISKDMMWKKSTAKGITIPIGMSDEGNQINLQLGDGADVFHALIGGATGKGKTILLHDIIINGAKLYHPDELQFFLMDYKEGTEFNVYQKLPSLKVLTVSSEIEFGLSVLEYINEEIVKRGNLFKSEGVSDFSEYKLSGKGTLPRFLVIMDEFQVLLNPQKRTTPRIAGLIEDITRRGRSFGINLVLSTQSLGDVDLSISTLGQIGVRIAMAMPSHDCIRILSMDNDLPVSFSKAGQAVYNNSLGRKEANSPFQVAFIDKNKISDELNLFPTIPDKKYVENQFIFDGSNNIHFEDNLEFSELIKSNSLKINDVYTDIYIGEPFYLSIKHFAFRIRKQHTSNLLIVGDDAKAAISVSFYTLYQLLLQSSKESQIFVIDLFGVDSGIQGGYDSLKDLGPNIEVTSKVKSAEEFIGLVKAELNKRFEEEGRKGRIILCLMNINSFRQLKRTDYSLSPLATDLLSIIKDGPEYGIHTIIHTLNKKSFEEIFEYNIYSEFENVVLLKGYNPSDFNSGKYETVTKDFTAFVISPRCKYSADKIKIYKQ